MRFELEASGQRTTAYAPLLWVALPLLTGYAAGRVVPDLNPAVLLLSAGLLLVGRAVLALVAGKRREVLGRVLLATALLGVAASSWVVRTAPRLDGEQLTLPIREVDLELQTLWLYQRADRYNRVSGIARVARAPKLQQDLQDRRVYFQLALQQGLAVPVKTTRFRVLGLLEPTRRPGERGDFQRYLSGFGVEHILRRGKIVETVAAGGPAHRLQARVQSHLEATLLRGAAGEQSAARTLVAMLLGETAVLEDAQRERFRASGTLHLFAISGLHIGLIGIVLGFLFRRAGLGMLGGGLASLALLLVYVWAVGAPPSAVRAVTMFGFFWVGMALRRQAALFPALVASACLVLIFFPLQMLSPGFQLSYAIVAAIVLYAIPLTHFLVQNLRPWALVPDASLKRWQRMFRWLFQSSLGIMAVSLAALIAGSPLIAAFFGVFTPGTIILSLPLTALAFATIAAGAISLLAGAVFWLGLSALANQLAYLSIGAMEQTIRAALAVPGLFFKVDARSLGLAYISTLLILFVMYVAVRARRAGHPLALLGPPALLILYALLNLRF